MPISDGGLFLKGLPFPAPWFVNDPFVLGGSQYLIDDPVLSIPADIICGRDKTPILEDLSGVPEWPLDLPRKFSPSSVVTFVLFRNTN